MDFAKNILSKYGWQDGEGLGKEKQGIKKPIKANLKFDNSGLGANANDSEFGNNWWERCFNDAAQNVKVQKEQNGNVKVDLKDAENSVEVSTKGYSIKKLKNSGSGVYGNNFLSSDVSVASFAMKTYKVLTDEELFQACGGRTAHKGARHGLKLSGKLARIEQQEKEILAKMQKNNTEISKFDRKQTECEKEEVEHEDKEMFPRKKKKRTEQLEEEVHLKKKKVKSSGCINQLGAENLRNEPEGENFEVASSDVSCKFKKKRKNIEPNSIEKLNQESNKKNGNKDDEGSDQIQKSKKSKRKNKTD